MNTNYPFISVILPIRNEEDKILSTLNSILNQNYKSDKIEILISDGSSYDNTINIINNIANQDPRIKIIKNIYKIVSTGFNLALNDAKGDIIIRIDGHCEITQNYFEKCYNLLKETDADIVGGVIQTISSGLIGNSISIAQSSPFGVGGVKFRRMDLDKGSYVDTLAFGAHRRELFVDIGGYDEEMVCNQDDEYNNRVLQAEKKYGWIQQSEQNIMLDQVILSYLNSILTMASIKYEVFKRENGFFQSVILPLPLFLSH